MYFKKVIFCVLGGIELMLLYPPDNIRSAISQWLNFFGIENFPNFLNNPSIDKWLSRICLVIIVYLVFSLIKEFIREKTKMNLKYLTKLHEEGLSLTRLLLDLIAEKSAMKDVARLDDTPKEIKKWRNKVSKIIPEEYVWKFNNLPASDQGPLPEYLLRLHRHSLNILAMAARGERVGGS